jgi:protein-tyrosine phosphatase
MKAAIDARFGSWRGAARLALACSQIRFSNLLQPPSDPSAVTRLVFVCRGNISRSAFAQGLALQKGLASESFGLFAASDMPADPVAIEIAREFSVDLSEHRSTAVDGFEPEKGDLLLAMEVRQLTEIRAYTHLADQPRMLLGQFCGTPHLHDPFTLSPAYYRQCFARITRAVDHLAALYPAARPCEK